MKMVVMSFTVSYFALVEDKLVRCYAYVLFNMI